MKKRKLNPLEWITLLCILIGLVIGLRERKIK